MFDIEHTLEHIFLSTYYLFNYTFDFVSFPERFVYIEHAVSLQLLQGANARSSMQNWKMHWAISNYLLCDCTIVNNERERRDLREMREGNLFSIG